MTLVSGQATDEHGPSPAPLDAVSFQSPHSDHTLVLAFGNILLGDDGAGLHLLERLRERRPVEGRLGAVQFIDGGTMSFSLLSYVEAAACLLVVDAAELNGAPGTIALFEGAAMDDFLKSARRRTVHEVGLIDLLDMARLRDCLPDRRALLCMQPGRIDWGETLSSPVAGALTEAARQASGLLERWDSM